MLRRIISALAIAAAAVLAPAAAAAADEYAPGDPPCTITFDGLTVTVGEPFGLTVTCTDLDDATVTVQLAFAGEAAADDGAVEVAGVVAEQLNLDEDGTASSTATVSAPGDYTVRILDAAGEPLSQTYTITAVAAGADSPVGDGATGGDGGLASTGSTSLPYLAAAGGLLLLGVAVLVTSRMRARHS